MRNNDLNVKKIDYIWLTQLLQELVKILIHNFYEEITF